MAIGSLARSLELCCGGPTRTRGTEPYSARCAGDWGSSCSGPTDSWTNGHLTLVNRNNQGRERRITWNTVEIGGFQPSVGRRLFCCRTPHVHAQSKSPQDEPDLGGGKKPITGQSAHLEPTSKLYRACLPCFWPLLYKPRGCRIFAAISFEKLESCKQI